MSVVALSLVSLGAAAPQVGRVQVLVTTSVDPFGLTDKATTERQEAVSGIRKRLGSNRALRFAAGPSDGVVIINVTSVEIEQVWRPTLYASPKVLPRGSPATDVTHPMTVARATLTKGTFSTDFAEAAGAYRGSAQENLARAIESWFHDNERVLLAKP